MDVVPADFADSTTPEPDYASVHDLAVVGRYEAREADWRNGHLAYQVIVDRFVPAADLDAKRHLYPAPKRLRSWDEDPTQGSYLADEEVWSHEIDFWGGDLASLRTRLDYIADLGADVVYLCPIHLAWTNHGYDALDYEQVRPEYGSREDVKALADDLHQRGIKLVLDGVFNHMGRQSALFQEALGNPDSPHRDWFDFDESYPGGARAWANAVNLPELVIENPEVQRHIWGDADSVVRGFLNDGVDGWRLDVAFELGMVYLDQITRAAHETKPGSLVLGEICLYPTEWFPAVDGLLSFSLRHWLLLLANRQISAPHAQRMLERYFADADFEHLLKCWVYLDNHDVERVTNAITDPAARWLATVLQFTLPGSVNLYYGSELGQTGGDDPECRGPMRWDWVNEHNQTLAGIKRLIQLRQDHRALRVGDIRWLGTDRLLGFQRRTDRIGDAVFVLANPSSEHVHEIVMLPESKLMDRAGLTDALSGQRFFSYRSTVTVDLAPNQVLVLTPDLDPVHGYSPYKRVQ